MGQGRSKKKNIDLLGLFTGPRHGADKDVAVLMEPFTFEMNKLCYQGMKVSDKWFGEVYNIPDYIIHVYLGAVHADSPARISLLRAMGVGAKKVENRSSFMVSPLPTHNTITLVDSCLFCGLLGCRGIL